MFRRTAFALITAWALAPSAAFSEAVTSPVNIRAGSLSGSLDDLQSQTGIELLFDPALLGGLEAPALRGNLTTEEALGRLLAGTNLTIRRAQSGAWIVEASNAPPLAEQDAPVVEILVVGRRTQNADIRRFETDVQPYDVATGAEIRASHRDNIEQYFQSRVTSDTSIGTAFTTASHVDLRGLGAANTLVLIDGRRMPGLSISGANFDQADLNAIPLHAIERIETLTGAAGGIHGFGALGGVVNVVLDRESRGFDIHAMGGISSRGDALREGLELSYGATSLDGRTDFTVFAATSRTDSLRVGDRDLALRDRAWNASRGFVPQFGDSLRIVSLADPTFTIFSPDLTFKPEFGGGVLPSDVTYLPTALTGDPAALIAALTQHAGEIDVSLDAGMANSDLGANPETSSLLLNLRHRFGGGFEAFLDVVALRTRNETANRSYDAGGFALLGPDAPANPFADYVFVFFPVESGGSFSTRTSEATRYTGGLIADLPFDWRGTAEFSVGSFDFESRFVQRTPLFTSFGLTGDPSDPDINPFGDWDTFQRAIARNRTFDDTFTTHTRFRDQSLRLAGPVFYTDAGATTLTLLAQHRSQEAPGYTETLIDETDGVAFTSETLHAPTSTEQTSLYAELRSPLFAETAPVSFLRGLELQLAVRHDEEADDFTGTGLVVSPAVHADFSGTAYTFGVKVTPTPWLLLRTSYATGQQVPPLSMLVENIPEEFPVGAVLDPKRGNLPGADGTFVHRSGGFAGLEAVQASTFSVGGVLTPFGEDGPVFTLDFSRIHRTHDPDPSLTLSTVLEHEDFWPERIERGPLTDADRALGYTAGPLLAIDTRIINNGELTVDTLDLRGEWPIGFFGGRLRLYGAATYQMQNVRSALFLPDVENVGYFGEPLRWRANAGLDWTNGEWSLGANLQYFDSYLIYHPLADTTTREFLVDAQGGPRVPSQSYLDLYATWQLPIRQDVTISFGAVNVLDSAPPRETTVGNFSGQGFSPYGDPRMRRFELVISSHF